MYCTVWLVPGLHLMEDTAPSGQSIYWRLSSSVQCPSATLSPRRAIWIPGLIGAGILSSVGYSVVPSCVGMGRSLPASARLKARRANILTNSSMVSTLKSLAMTCLTYHLAPVIIRSTMFCLETLALQS
ncbi:hypothetical protein EVAR_32530_1 [Eumeta japonica]|uniref:Uncharacterized protein n=1 Tax=Eumeta variegata TaxID=151549 RepID=A0A4C1W7G2_EUMVA|nr:hypothetical protein EVAR_32530_1 [Eumeta japonica]